MVKGKILWMGIIAAYTMAVVPATAMQKTPEVPDPVEKKETAYDLREHAAAVLFESKTVNYSVRKVKVSGSINPFFSGKTTKYKLSVKEDSCIGCAVDRYMIFIASLTHYAPHLARLRRLNI
ncbi:MAG: hypothetical protein LBS09_04375 [Bacteroidales bacterium]|jgi:hypothetical protein|nr:hypothetical protein [Bacteroidales bacterium]